MTRLVLTNANLLDGDSPAQTNRVVVVEGDRIASVSGAPPPDVTAADRVVDLGGRSLMPGMITCHYHSTYRELGAVRAPYGLEHAPAYQALIAADNLRTALECGFTGAVGAGCSNDIDASMKRAIDDGLIPGPRFVPSGHELSTTGHSNDANPWYWDLREWGAARCCDGPDAFRAAVRDEVKRGVEMVKLFVTGGHGVTAPKTRMEMTREELDAVVDAAHARDARVRGHIVNKEAILTAIDAGVDVIDHADEMDDECIERMVGAGSFVAPSCYFPTALLEVMGGGLGFAASMREDLDRMLEVLPKANAAGVKLVVGDDYGAVGFPHGRYASELEVYVRDAGVAPLDVLRWATVHGAELMGRSHELGRVATGYLADLLVVAGDPSRDITVLQDCDNLVAIMKGGQLFKDTLAAYRVILMLPSSAAAGVGSCSGEGGGTSPQTWRQLVEILLINFSLEEMTESEYRKLCDEVAPAFASVPGLVTKVWLADRENGVYGGVYTFENGAALDAYLTTDLSNVAAIPGLVDISVRRFEVLAEPTAITRGLVTAAA